MADSPNPMRNKLLYGALFVVLALYAFDYGYQGLYKEPIRKSENRIAALNTEIQDTRLKVAKAKKATRVLSELQQRSLPYRLEQARSSYQAWLLELGKQSQLTSVNVDSGEPLAYSDRGRVLFQSISFTLRGRGSMKQITQLLHDFYAAGHLHKIRTITFNPVGAAELVDVNLTIDTVAMPTADRESALTELPANRSSSPRVEDYRYIAARNLFQAGGQGIGRFIKLSAVTSNRSGVLEAWFKDTRSDKSYRRASGQTLSVGSLDLRVDKIEKKQVTVVVDEQTWTVKRGQTIADSLEMNARTAATGTSDNDGG